MRRSFWNITIHSDTLHRSDIMLTLDIFTYFQELCIEHLQRNHADRGAFPPDTWSRPNWNLHVFYVLDQSFKQFSCFRALNTNIRLYFLCNVVRGLLYIQMYIVESSCPPVCLNVDAEEGEGFSRITAFLLHLSWNFTHRLSMSRRCAYSIRGPKVNTYIHTITDSYWVEDVSFWFQAQKLEG